MEDGVTEDEIMAAAPRPLNLSPRGHHLYQNHNKEEGRSREEEEELPMPMDTDRVGLGKHEDGGGGGFINHLISNLIHVHDDETEEGDHGKEAGPGPAAEDENGGGGLIGHLINNSVTPLSPRSGGEWIDSPPEAESEGLGQARYRAGGGSSEAEVQGSSGNSVGGGGVIGNIISSILHHPNGGGEGEAGMGRSAAEDGSRGGGIIDNLVSHFPTALPEDAAPTTDEASILIHSLVKD